MPSVFSKFTNSFSSGFSGLDNLTGDGVGNATFTAGADGTLQTFASDEGPNIIPSTATLTGISFAISITLGGGVVTFTGTPKNGSTNGTIQTFTYNTSQSKLYGGDDDLLGLTFSSVSDIANFKLRIQFSAAGTLNGSPGIQPTFHYTLPFSNKVYNTSGKFSITSGKVSIT